MEIGLCWYQKGTNNKWTYDLMDHLVVDLYTLIVVASKIYIIDLNACELLPPSQYYCPTPWNIISQNIGQTFWDIKLRGVGQ